ncbi:MAG: TatD family hydrolase [Chloroflexota bacterium]|nr:TatD family hydrolase [Chloroflexota bacterium]MDE2909267.1 TatD family hydrolase [Chloroflexota bacterium]
MQLVDTHCHLNFQRYDHDRADVLRRAADACVRRIIVPAIDLPSCREAIALAEREQSIYAAVGIHPNSSADFTENMRDELRNLARSPQVVAIGEIGLDYHWDKSPKPAQWRAFEAQLALASELELPVIIHNREGRVDTVPPGRVDTAPSSAANLLAILENWAPSAPASMRGRLGVLHSFSASFETAQHALALGFYLGFTGPLTFNKAEDLRDIAGRIPNNRIVIETDGPFLAPQQRRGRRNEPAFVRYINDKLADLHGVAPEEMARQTTGNAEALFRLASS